IIISIVLVACNRTQHKEPKIRFTGYKLPQGVLSFHIDIKIDSVTSLNNLIPKLSTNYELYPTFRGCYIGYNDLMFSIAVHGDSAIQPLMNFYYQTKSYNAKLAALHTLHLIGINCHIAIDDFYFSNMNVRKALFKILAEDDSLQSRVMMLLSRRALASDVPVLMDIMKSSKSDCWGISCGLLKYKLKNIPVVQKVPEELWDKTINLKYSADTKNNARLQKIFKKIKEKYKDCILVEDTLLHYHYEQKITFSGLTFLEASKRKKFGTSDLCDYCVPNYFEYGSNFQYYCKDNKLYFCSAMTSKRLWLEWWKSQTESYKDSLKNSDETIGTYSHRGRKY
ncbi:MAG TPA: hypothetical protein VI413_14730, partial [Paludibacter sp.]